jgi:ABC-type sugar transport system ATPase subunit
VHGREVRWPHSPRRAAELGIGLAPEDRRTQGLVMSLDAGANLVLPSLNRLSRLGFATRRRLDGTAATQAPAVGFDPTRMGARAGTLSGGNQQKLVLGKLLLTAPAVLLVDEPARGVDIGAKAEIFRLLLRLAGEGMAIVMVSEETDELLSLVDRLLVLRAGTVSAHFDAATADPDDVLTHMFPASAAPAA